ncbi:hypothetical protein T4D_13648 [Trichinella pseudospiralis]|uniref:Uncharacterized protein n=1 Tax=Trichinella pseudospiralis TaxID=6337 RepID=A0A0V1E8J2_TRIPS|nr:hypothetical protein T4D_13648 [Trichinella pseudospiralis]
MAAKIGMTSMLIQWEVSHISWCGVLFTISITHSASQ